MVAFEAAVAGGIPIIKALREGLTANRIQWIAGIINGTTNFILDAMATSGMSYEDALAEATRLGYAEADPTADVEGFDAAQKASILASLAFHTTVPLDAAACRIAVMVPPPLAVSLFSTPGGPKVSGVL